MLQLRRISPDRELSPTGTSGGTSLQLALQKAAGVPYT